MLTVYLLAVCRLLQVAVDICVVFHGHRKLDGQQASPKITKHHFFQDNQVSF